MGLWRALVTRDVFSANVALAAVMAKVTPLLLSNVPFRNTVTWKMHEACTWMVIVILGHMVVVLVGSVWVRQPRIPVEPTSIAGCMYLICDSAMTRDFEGLSTVAKKERDHLVRQMNKGYTFGRIAGVSGSRRVGVDYARDWGAKPK